MLTWLLVMMDNNNNNNNNNTSYLKFGFKMRARIEICNVIRCGLTEKSQLSKANGLTQNLNGFPQVLFDVGTPCPVTLS